MVQSESVAGADTKLRQVPGLLESIVRPAGSPQLVPSAELAVPDEQSRCSALKSNCSEDRPCETAR